MKKFFLTTLVAMLCWTASNAKVNGTEPEDNTPDGVEAVDMGLSVKWANVNMGAKKSTDFGDYYAWGETKGAKKSTDFGDYYAWGETKTKDYYSWDSYIWSRGNSPMLTKYSVGDRKSQLTLADDAAHANWGGKWRMPTEAECEELANPDNCIWEWTTNNGINGYKVTSKKTGNSIFLPITGFRFYGQDKDRFLIASSCYLIANGKKYKVKKIRKDSDDVNFTIKNFKAGRNYTITVKGVKTRGTKKYGRVSGTLNTAPAAAPAANIVSREQALNIAQQHAAATWGTSGFYDIRTESDRDAGTEVWDVEFKGYVGGVLYEYDYTISKNGGTILSYESEIED